MIRLHSRNAQAIYTAVQSLFWLTYGLMFAFASAYLQDRGFSNSEIGIVLGCSYGLSTLLQPALAGLFARRGIPTERGMIGVYCITMLLAAVLLAAPLPNPWAVPLVVLIFSLESALQPSVDTLARRWTNLGCPVNYGASRGLGSLLYAGMTAGMGLLLKRMAPRCIPAFYLATMALSVAILSLLRIPAGSERAGAAAQTAGSGKFPGKGMFAAFLAGVSCLSMGHVVVDNFMLQIMQNIGGDSGSLGIAISIASLVEFPAMMCYSRLSKRFGAERLLIFSAWAWLAKNVLILTARTPMMIFLAEVLQFCSYGFYIPASIEYIARRFSRQDNLKGQSYAGSAYTVGCVIATFLGGVLLDALGVFTALTIVCCITLLGALLFSLSVRKVQ